MAADYSKILLDESEMPTQWYNVIPDLPTPPPPPLHPGTHEPIGPDDLAPLFPMALIMQEVSTDSYIGTHNFQVEIEGIDVINTEFVSVSGVVSETEEIEFAHGTDPEDVSNQYGSQRFFIGHCALGPLPPA